MQLVDSGGSRFVRVARVPHVPRPPSFDHGFISFLWAVGLGAYIYFGSIAVGVSSGTAFVFAADATRAVDEFTAELYSSRFDARRLALGR